MIFYADKFLKLNSVLTPDVGAELAKFRDMMRMATETLIITGQTLFPWCRQSGAKYQPALGGQTSLNRKM
jgi:hypothetical protein